MTRGDAISLIGFMGAGKTTVGRELARRREWPLFDTDDTVAARFGLPLAKVFECHGEDKFRAAESDALAEMPKRRAIVATGGGIVLLPKNLQLLRRLGPVIYLETEEVILYERVSVERSRPLLLTTDPRATLSRLLREREPLYRAAADFTVNTTTLDVSQVAEAILEYVG
ncbi:MAG: shikimate kinase [Chthoniobacterales bacterium]